MARKVVLKVDVSSCGSDKMLLTIWNFKGVHKVDINSKGYYPLYTVTGDFKLTDLLKAVEEKTNYVSVESVEEPKKGEKSKENKKEKADNQIVLKTDSNGWMTFPNKFSGIPDSSSVYLKVEKLHVYNGKR